MQDLLGILAHYDEPSLAAPRALKSLVACLQYWLSNVIAKPYILSLFWAGWRLGSHCRIWRQKTRHCRTCTSSWLAGSPTSESAKPAQRMPSHPPPPPYHPLERSQTPWSPKSAQQMSPHQHPVYSHPQVTMPNHQIWRHYQSTSKVHARVLQTLIVCQSSSRHEKHRLARQIAVWLGRCLSRRSCCSSLAILPCCLWGVIGLPDLQTSLRGLALGTVVSVQRS